MSNITRSNVSYALNQPLNLDAPYPIVAKRAPTTADKAPIGQEWVFTTSNLVYILTSIVNNLANWQLLTTSAGPGIFTSLTVTPGPTSLTGSFTLIAGTNTAHIADDAADHSTILGSNTGVSATTINGGTGAITLSPAATGTIVIGTAAETGDITLGLSTAGQIVNINTSVNAGAQVTNINNGASAANSTVNILNGIGTAGVPTLNLMANAAQTVAGIINIGTGTGANIVTIGSVTSTAGTTIQGGLVGIAINAAGNVSMAPDVAAPVASPTATVVSNNRVGYATFTGFTTAAAGSQIFTVTNSIVSATSAIFVTVGNLGTNDAQMCMTRVKAGAGTFDVDTQNFGAAALNGDVSISWWVIN